MNRKRSNGKLRSQPGRLIHPDLSRPNPFQHDCRQCRRHGQTRVKRINRNLRINPVSAVDACFHLGYHRISEKLAHYSPASPYPASFILAVLGKNKKTRHRLTSRGIREARIIVRTQSPASALVLAPPAPMKTRTSSRPGIIPDACRCSSRKSPKRIWSHRQQHLYHPLFR